MAIKEIKREWSPCQLDYVKTFLLHSEKDLKDLPKCCIGSKAIVSETDNEYFCTESGWKLGSELGGGGEVVILPETELTVLSVDADGGQYMLTTPFENKPTGGSTCKFIWGGVEYTSPVVDAQSTLGAPFPLLVFGNTDFMGLTEGLGSNPAPDAPYIGMMYPDGMEEDGVVQYLLFAARGDIVADPPVLSIVQTEGAASGGAADAPVVIAKLTNNGGTYSIDKTFDEIVALVQGGKIVYLQHIADTQSTLLQFANYTGSSTPQRLIFSALLGGKQGMVVTYTPDGVTPELESY